MRRRPLILLMTALAGALAVLLWNSAGQIASKVGLPVPGAFGRKPEKLLWDFRKGNTPAAVDWPSSISGEWYEREGEFDLTIIGREGNIVFHQQVQHFNILQRDGKLEAFNVLFASFSDSEDAYRAMKQVMTDWKFPQDALSDVEKWHEALVSKMSHPEFVQLHQRLNDMHNGLNYGLYPGFSVGGAGAELRATTVSGSPESGDVKLTLSLIF